MADEKTTVSIEIDANADKATQKLHQFNDQIDRVRRNAGQVSVGGGTPGVRSSSGGGVTGAWGGVFDQAGRVTGSSGMDPHDVPGKGAPTGAGHGGGTSGGGGGGGKKPGGRHPFITGAGTTVGQMRSGGAAAVAMLSGQLMQISFRHAAADIMAQSDVSAGQKHRRRSMKTQADISFWGKAGLFGAGALGILATPFTGGMSLGMTAASMGLAGGVAMGVLGGAADAAGEYAAADDNLKANALERIQGRAMGARGILRGLGRGRSSARRGAGLGRGRSANVLQGAVDQGFDPGEAGKFFEAANVGGIGAKGMFGAHATYGTASGSDLASLQRAGFSPSAGMAGMGMFQRGGGAAGGGSRSVFASYRQATAFGLRGSAADAFVTRLSKSVEGRFGQTGMTTDIDFSRDQLELMSRDKVLGERGSRNIDIQQNMRASGMSLRNDLVGQIGGAMDKMSQFQTFGKGVRSTGTFLGGLDALEKGSSLEARRKSLGGISGTLGVMATMHAAGTSVEETRALRNLGYSRPDPAQRTAEAMNTRDIVNAGSTEYNTGGDLRKGELSRLNELLGMTNGGLDKLFGAINANTDHLERIGRGSVYDAQ